MEKNIIILAGGPPKKGRNRHLELYSGEHIIDRVIKKCKIPNTKLYIIIDKENIELRNHILSKWSLDLSIIIPEDKKIYSTFKSALSIEGDCIMVLGDLIGLQEGDIERFVNSEYKSATCQYQHSWGSHINSQSGNLLRRADCGDAISLISHEHKKEFLESKNYKDLFYKFYPNGNQYEGMNENWYNDVGTFLSYSFFFEIWSNPEWCHKDNEKGAILFNHIVYKDND